MPEYLRYEHMVSEFGEESNPKNQDICYSEDLLQRQHLFPKDLAIKMNLLL